MSDSKLSKFVWLVVGGVIGGAISLSYKVWIEPLVSPKALLTFESSSAANAEARFTISNDGNAVATNVSVSIWATAPFAARTDIVDISHAGGASDADCEVGLYQSKLTGIASSIPTHLNTEAQAVLVHCDRIRPGESWIGEVRYRGPEAVFGLTALVKDDVSNEILYGRFGDSE